MIVNDYNISADEYIALYERYLHRSPDELLLAAGDIKGKQVLDLCAGTMRASNRAKELGASYVVALDKSSSIIPKDHKADAVVISDIEDIQSSRLSLFTGRFDLIVCQQGINYWFSDKNIEAVSKLLKWGGSLVFNTFNTRPSKDPVVKKFGGGARGDEITEVVQLVNDTVYHLQMRKGYVPHFTSFKYIAGDDIENIVNTHFSNVHSIIDGSTTIYTCER